MHIATPDLGYRWIAQATGVQPVQPWRVSSRLGSRRQSVERDGVVQLTFGPRYQPAPTLADHFAFALKYEGVELDFMARVLAQTGPDFVLEWLGREPAGGYARRMGFFYEWLTGQTLPGVADATGNYVDAIDASRYLVATQADKNRRWRVNNNLPGTPDFCPMLTVQPGQIAPQDLMQAIAALYQRFGPETIERAVGWLTLKESRASFVIESEGKAEDRIRRFARAMLTHCGQGDEPLALERIAAIQADILGSVTTGFQPGLRRSPVFVGHTNAYQPVMDYLAPHFDQVPALMAGLRELERRTRGQNPILRAAALSFGLVYIHPLADGNGRLSRFLINDTLRRDGVTTHPLILPVSAIIAESSARRHAYDGALEQFSRPLMAALEPACRFGEPVRYADGVRSNLQCDGWDVAASSWRYPELSMQASYLGGVITDAIQHGLHDEALYLQRYDRAETALKHEVEGSAEDYAAIIRALVQHRSVSNKLRKTYPSVFNDEARAARITRQVLMAFELLADAGASDDDGGDEDNSAQAGGAPP